MPPPTQSGKLHPFQSSIRLSSVHQYPLSSFRSKISRREIVNCAKSWQQYWMWLESHNGAFQRGGQGASLACSALFEVRITGVSELLGVYFQQRRHSTLMHSLLSEAVDPLPKPSLLSDTVPRRRSPSPRAFAPASTIWKTAPWPLDGYGWRYAKSRKVEAQWGSRAFFQ